MSRGAMSQQTFTSLCCGEGPAAAGWGSWQHGPLSKAWKNFSAHHTQRLQSPKTAPVEQIFPGHRSAVEETPQCGVLILQSGLPTPW